MALSVGDKLGHLKIAGPLGAGGMGEVYRALDTQLNREVAVKVLPQAMARDPERLARSDREAKILAALNHPNIAVIYGLVESAAGRALVMELVPGDTLGARIKRGAMPVEEALQVAKQMAEALEAAHEKGVTHRDLKPGNVMITPTGLVKVLDFGLAAMSAPSASVPGDPENSPTLTMGMTQAGAIMGTAAYMSPEQAAGTPVDRRADIWSYGVVLYEMLTGKRLFGGESISHTLADVLRAPIDFEAIPAGPLRKLLKRCLDRSLKTRLQSIAEARIAIEEMVANPESGAENSAQAMSRPFTSKLPWAIAAVLLLSTLAVGFTHFRETPPVAQLITSAIPVPPGTAFEASNSGGLALSPDGKWIVFTARDADNKSPLWLRPLASPTAQILPGTDGAAFPFWSPDSRFVAFFAGGKLKKIDIAGGPALAIADAAQGRGGSWSPQGIILFKPLSGAGPLFKVAASGGVASPATSTEASKLSIHRFPWFLPDGRHFLFQDSTPGSGVNSILRIGSIDSQDAVSLGTASSDAVYSNGYLLFLREDTLMAQPFDADKRATLGEAVPVAENVTHALNNGVKGRFTVSTTGFLVYHTGGGARSQKLTWFDRTGKSIGTLGEPGDFASLELSPNRKSAAVASADASGNDDIWIYDIARDLRTRFTFAPSQDREAVWSPDGSAIAWHQNGQGQLLSRSADGKGTEKVLYEEPGIGNAHSWSPDGKFLLFDKSNGVWSLTPSTEKPESPWKPTALVDTPFTEEQGAFSPDGRWVAYRSDESQRSEIYVVPFPGPGGKRQVSTMGGRFPRWRHDGKEMFFVAPGGTLMAAEVTIKPASVEVGQVRSLDIKVPTNRGIPYDVSLDGQRILAITDGESNSSSPLTLVENWTGLLKK